MDDKDEFVITIKCSHEVYEEEWIELLFLINRLLKEYDGGKYNNVGAFLERKIIN